MNDRVIEVIGSAMIVRPVELHRATITFIVRSKKTSDGHDRLLELRERVIAAMLHSGIEKSDIVDVGVAVRRSIWSYRQSLVQTLCIQTADCECLVKSISAIGQVFQDVKPGYFSGMEHDFSFEEDEPVYASEEEANELALRSAVQNATAKATILAEQSGLILERILSIAEIHRPPRKRTEFGATVEDPVNFESHLKVRGYNLGSGELTYTRTAPRKTAGLLELRVVFAVTESSTV